MAFLPQMAESEQPNSGQLSANTTTKLQKCANAQPGTDPKMNTSDLTSQNTGLYNCLRCLILEHR
jgi:hypothetical protein